MLAERAWMMCRFGRDRDQPELVGAVYHWPRCADVVVFESESAAVAWRCPPTGDVFAPTHVTRIFAGPLSRTLREALSWPDPTTEACPPGRFTAPPGCAVPEELRRPMHITPTRGRTLVHDRLLP
jgi:hypothetical protein